MKHRLLKATLTMKIRDFAAFEDLAGQLGVNITECQFVDAGVEQPLPAPRYDELGEIVALKPRSRGYTRHRVMMNHVKAALKMKKEHPHMTQVGIARALELPYGSATLSRIFGGGYGHQ